MPDITMCQNAACPKAGICYRFTAKPSERQSYAVFSPDENGNCESFLQIKEKFGTLRVYTMTEGDRLVSFFFPPPKPFVRAETPEPYHYREGGEVRCRGEDGCLTESDIMPY